MEHALLPGSDRHHTNELVLPTHDYWVPSKAGHRLLGPNASVCGFEGDPQTLAQIPARSPWIQVPSPGRTGPIGRVLKEAGTTMPRLSEVPRDEAPEGIVTTMYDFIFGDRDPVAEPGLVNGTIGNWWTVAAQDPDFLEHCVSGFAYYRSPRRTLSAELRELAQTRVGWAAGSRFVYSQHCKASRDNGVEEEKIRAIPYWQSADCYDEVERAVLAWVDVLVLQRGRADEGSFLALRKHLSELEIIELTYISCLYDMHAVMSKAFRLELDDVEDRVTELEGEGISRGLGMG